MKRKFLLISIILLLCTSYSYAQWRKRKQIQYSGLFDSYFWRGPFNYYAMLGTTPYFGDLCSGIGCNKLKPSFGVGANYNTWARIMLGAEFQYFGMGSVDENVSRNLGFKSKNCEFTAYGRFEIIYNRILKHTERNKKPKLIKPFVGLGMSMVRYKAETFSVGPGFGTTLPKESVVYPRWSFVIPIALGTKITFSRRSALVLQGVYRVTFTDWLDEISTLRGAANKDAYASINVSFEYTPTAKRSKKKKAHPKHEDEEGTSSPPANNSETTPENNTDEPVNNNPEPKEETKPEEKPDTPENKPEEKPEDKPKDEDEWDDSNDGWGDDNDNTDDEDNSDDDFDDGDDGW